jgi:hypothetical protein
VVASLKNVHEVLNPLLENIPTSSHDALVQLGESVRGTADRKATHALLVKGRQAFDGEKFLFDLSGHVLECCENLTGLTSLHGNVAGGAKEQRTKEQIKAVVARGRWIFSLTDFRADFSVTMAATKEMRQIEFTSSTINDLRSRCVRLPPLGCEGLLAC